MGYNYRDDNLVEEKKEESGSNSTTKNDNDHDYEIDTTAQITMNHQLQQQRHQHQLQHVISLEQAVVAQRLLEQAQQQQQQHQLAQHHNQQTQLVGSLNSLQIGHPHHHQLAPFGPANNAVAVNAVTAVPSVNVAHQHQAVVLAQQQVAALTIGNIGAVASPQTSTTGAALPLLPPGLSSAITPCSAVTAIDPLFAATSTTLQPAMATVAQVNVNPLLPAAVASNDPTINILALAAAAVNNTNNSNNPPNNANATSSTSTATAPSLLSHSNNATAAQSIASSASVSIAGGVTIVPSTSTQHHPAHHHQLSLPLPQLQLQSTIPPHVYVPPIPPTWGSQTPALSVQDRPLVPPIYNGINPNYPGAQLLHAHPPIFAVDNFLTPAECDFLIDNANDAFGPAPVVGRGSGEVSPSRTSSTCYLAREDLPEYLRKVSLLTGKPASHCELPQVGRYMPSQQYLQHFDAFDLSNDDGRRFAMNGGQRTVTVLVYLNNVPRGGATAFPNLNIEVQPRRGMALVFFPSTLDGLLDKMALHAALPAVDVKYVSQVWIRQSDYEGQPSKRLGEPMVGGLQERREARERSLLMGQFAGASQHGHHHPPPPLHHHDAAANHQVQAAQHAARQVQAAQQHAQQAHLHQAQQVAQQQQQHLHQQGYQPMGN